MRDRKVMVFSVLVAFCLTATLFMVLPTRSNPGLGEYDHWVDLNDDGWIDIYDAITLANAFGVSGTPINKTALRLELQTRVDELNATVLYLIESRTRRYADIIGTSTNALSQVTIVFPEGKFVAPLTCLRRY